MSNDFKKKRRVLTLGNAASGSGAAAASHISPQPQTSSAATALLDVFSAFGNSITESVSNSTEYSTETDAEKEIRIYYEKYSFLNTLDRDPKKPPERIYGVYSEEKEFDIMEIHKCILDVFYFERFEKIDLMKKELSLLIAQYESKFLSMNDRISVSNKIERLKESLRVLENGEDLANYLFEAEDILKEFYALRALTPPETELDGATLCLMMIQSISFSTKKEKKEYCESYLKSIQEKKHICIIRYIPIANRYIPTILTKIHSNVNSSQLTDFCYSCQNKLEIEMNISGNKSCKICGAEQLSLSKLKGCGSVKTVRTQDNERFDKFKKTFYSFQGKQHFIVPPNLFPDLDKYFRDHQFPSREQIQARSLDHKGRKQGTNLAMMLTALKQSGNSPRFDDVHLICKLYWGWELPDISHLEERVFEHYLKTEKRWMKMPEDMKNNFNVNVRLFKELSYFNYPCDEEDFKLLAAKNHNIYIKMWEFMIEEE